MVIPFVLAFFRGAQPKTINIAGTRESKAKGIQWQVTSVVKEAVTRYIKGKEGP